MILPLTRSRCLRLLGSSAVLILAACRPSSTGHSSPNTGSSDASTGSTAGESTTGGDPYPPVILADDPVAYYRLDDSSGVLADHSGHSLDGVYGQISLPSAGLIADGDGAHANSGDIATGVFASVAARSALEPATAITVEAWVQPGQASVNPSQSLVAYGDSTVAPYEAYKLELTAPNLLSFQIAVGGATYRVNSTQAFAQGQTLHLAGTYDATSGTQALYIDGQPAAWGTLAVNPTGISPHWIACLGDSLTVGNGPTQDYPSYLAALLDGGSQVGGFGHDGATLLPTGDLPYDQQPEYQAANTFVGSAPAGDSIDVVIFLGTNDSKPYNWTTPQAFSEAYISLIQHFQSLNPNVQVFLVLPPTAFANGYSIQESIIEEELPLIRQVASQLGLATIDLHTPTGLVPQDYVAGDGVHFTDTGYAYLAQLIEVGILVGKLEPGEKSLGPYTDAGLTLGARSDGTSSLVGTLDEVAVFSAALPASRIQAHDAAGRLP
jgi:acyl-CoA thioesterase I